MKSLRAQLLLRSVLIVMLLLLFIGVLQYLLMGQFLYHRTALTIQSEILGIPDSTWTENVLNPQPQSDAEDHHDSPFESAFGPLQDKANSIAFIDTSMQFHSIQVDASLGASPKLAKQVYQQLLAQGKAGNQYQLMANHQGQMQLVVLQTVGDHDSIHGIVEVATSTTNLQDELVRELLIFVGLTVFALLLAMAVFWPIISRTLIPLSRLVEMTSKINAGNLDARFSPKGAQTEIRQLADSFNAMLDRLDTSFQAERIANAKMRQFVADASHELRTPLTSIHGFLEVLLRGASQNPEQLARSLKSMHSESNRMGKLVNDLIFLARMDQVPQLLVKKADIAEVIHEMEPQLRLLAKDRTVVFQLSPQLFADVDIDKIKQVILNLFHNAVSHTDASHGEIKVFAYQEQRSIYFGVKDNGEGIESALIPNIFERFYRVDSSRSHKIGGAGLGLAITKSIVDLHHATIECVSEKGAGAMFQVILPTHY